MPDPEVFVSYSRKDAAAVDRLVAALTAAGVTVWRDDRILCGQDYMEAIGLGMATVKVVVVACSHHALASAEVRAELSIARVDLKKPILPVWVTDPAQTEIPPGMLYFVSKAKHYLRLDNPDWLRGALAALTGHGVGTNDPPPPPSPPPPSPPPPSPPPPPPSPPVPVSLRLLDSEEAAREEQAAAAERLRTGVAWRHPDGVTFRLVPAGECWVDPALCGRPARVRVPRSFWVAAFPLTNRLVAAFLDDPGVDAGLARDRLFAPAARSGGADELPAVQLSAADAAALARWLGRADGRVYRLPTEAEWEYAARAGCATPAPPQEWTAPPGRPVPSDAFRANPFGLVDVVGNVAEWTATPFAFKPDVAALAATTADVRGARAVRGCGWACPPGDAGFGWRKSVGAARRADDTGVRVVCEVGDETA